VLAPIFDPNWMRKNHWWMSSCACPHLWSKLNEKKSLVITSGRGG